MAQPAVSPQTFGGCSLTLTHLIPAAPLADESALKMNSVDHIPQTLASHGRSPQDSPSAKRHGADMLKPDPRDTFYRSEYWTPGSVRLCLSTRGSHFFIVLNNTRNSCGSKSLPMNHQVYFGIAY